MVAPDSNPMVFVIEDDSPGRDSVRSLLKSMGLRAEAFGSAQEFLKTERPDVPSCLVLDLQVAGTNGRDFQEEMERAGIHIPVIFLAAHSDIPTAWPAMEAGTVELLAKPFQRDELLAAIEQALSRDRSRREERARLSTPPSEVAKSASNGRDVTFDIALLNKIASRLSAADAFHQVLSEVVEFVAAVVECDSCFVYLVEEDDLVLQASKNPHPEAIGRLKMRVGQGITGWVAEHRSPVAAGERAFEDPRFKLFNELPEDRFEAFLSVPLVSGGRLVGVINVQSRSPHRYTQHEIGLVTAVGFLVGAEVERARLESENSELSERLETRKLVERAKGVLQRELKISETDAYRILQRESQHRRKSMKDISESIILNDELKRAVKP
ncbi:MAG TPA: response regulator [Patescibacteria group bacterium]|nr:response regulator [Patescibacteria group bacterium]